MAEGTKAPNMRGRRCVFVPDHNGPRGFGAFMRSEQMRDVTEEVAKEIAAVAKSTAPRSEGEGPHYADQFSVVREGGEIVIGKGKHANARVAVLVINTSDHAAAIEFGNSRAPRRRHLARAGAAFGSLHVGEKGVL